MLVAGFNTQGRVDEITPRGKVVWTTVFIVILGLGAAYFDYRKPFNAAAGAIAAPNKHRARKVFMRLSVSECTPEVKNGRMACPAPAVTPLREAQYRSVTL